MKNKLETALELALMKNKDLFEIDNGENPLSAQIEHRVCESRYNDDLVVCFLVVDEDGAEIIYEEVEIDEADLENDDFFNPETEKAERLYKAVRRAAFDIVNA